MAIDDICDNFKRKTELIKKHPSGNTIESIKLNFERKVTRKLSKLNKDLYWLSEQLGVNRERLKSYIKGYTKPKREMHEKIFELLEIKYKSIDSYLY